MESSPLIVFIAGWWEGITPFKGISQSLTKLGYATLTLALPSTGSKDGTFPNDVRIIRSVLESIIGAEQEVVLVMHSAGGIVGSEAIEGLSKSAMRKIGKKGGVTKLVYMAAGIFPIGKQLINPPFVELEVRHARMIVMQQRVSMADHTSRATSPFVKTHAKLVLMA